MGTEIEAPGRPRVMDITLVPQDGACGSTETFVLSGLLLMGGPTNPDMRRYTV